MDEARHRQFEHRAPVDLTARPEAIARAFAALLARAPTDRIERCGPLGLAFRPEPPWFLAVAAVALLLLGLLGHLAVGRFAQVAVGGHGLAAVLELSALVALARVVFSLRWRTEIVAEGGDVVVREWLGARALRERRTRAEELTAALVVGSPGALRVVLVGPRNAERCRIYDEQWMDPPTLPRWLADALALLATGAACPQDDAA